jgi:CBS domain-containing protein
MATTVRSTMSGGKVEVVKSDETVLDAAKRLAENNIGAMPICDGDKLRGMLTDRDIVTKVVAQGRDPATVKARELETGTPVVVRADDTVEEAMRLMEQHKVRRLPVVDGDKLVGMISQADLAKALPKEKAGQLISAISSDW